MPLDNFQTRILKILAPLRSPESVFAGGSVIQYHGNRLSDDQDIFHDPETDIATIAQRDCKILRDYGFSVDLVSPFEGLFEAAIGDEEFGFTKVQWTAAGAYNFFKPVQDTEFGWRLHMADLAVNKCLAAGGRKKMRDFVDLSMLHNHAMPLWHAVWAAPGKDIFWNPSSLIERISRNNQWKQEDLDQDVALTTELSAVDVARTIHDAVEEARVIFARLPPEMAGRLFVDPHGGIINDVDRILEMRDVTSVETAKGGTWPSNPDIDAAMIRNIIEAYGDDKISEPSYDPSMRP